MSIKIITVLALGLSSSLLAQDITFTNKTATFTNLEGRVYKNVTLVRANDYGIVWRGDGMGMVSYTNLAPAVLESFGVGQERVDKARALLAHRAQVEAQQQQSAVAAVPVESDSVTAFRAYTKTDMTHKDYTAALRDLQEKAEADRTLPEQPGGESNDSGQILGAFGLKLGQVFDLRYATHTNKTTETMTKKGENIHVDMVNYAFKPRLALPPFQWYSVSVTPRSNLVYSIEASGTDYESYSSAMEDSDKLLAALEQKYGKATLHHNTSGSSDFTTYTIGSGRQVSLNIWHFTNSVPSLHLTYEDGALWEQARYEQAAIDAADPKRKAERDRLKNQL